MSDDLEGDWELDDETREHLDYLGEKLVIPLLDELGIDPEELAEELEENEVSER